MFVSPFCVYFVAWNIPEKVTIPVKGINKIKVEGLLITEACCHLAMKIYVLLPCSFCGKKVKKNKTPIF